jgi:hypothetical protein
LLSQTNLTLRLTINNLYLQATHNQTFDILNSLINVQLGYTVPKSILNRLKIPVIRLYVNGMNLYSFDNLKDLGLNPESDRPNGLDYPTMKIINVGANITL